MVYKQVNQTRQPSLDQVSQFISTSVLFLIYGVISEKNVGFEKSILEILTSTQNNVNCPVILISLLYISRYCEKIKYYGPIPKSCELKLWITALMLADATMNDAAYATKSWSLVTKIPIQECIRMRRVFLQVVNYDLHVTEVQYGLWINNLEQISAHVSSILAYKSVRNPSQPLLISQPLLKQPVITLSPNECSPLYSTIPYPYSQGLDNYIHHQGYDYYLNSPESCYSPEYLNPSLYYARVDGLLW
jgi:Cyclin